MPPQGLTPREGSTPSSGIQFFAAPASAAGPDGREVACAGDLRSMARVLRDVPADWPFSDVHRRIWLATASGTPVLDRTAAATLGALPYPRHYLDFETVAFAVPLWAGTRPWEALPFQWSLHSEPVPGELEHREFLDTSGEAPMRPCAETLLRAAGATGPIFTYSGYERTTLAALAARFPDLAPGLDALAARLVDLLPITRAAYYHRDMKGSWSIKDVLPTVAPDLDYGQLGEVQDGALAQLAYSEAIQPDTDPERCDELAAALLAYCGQDTLALVRLAHFLSDG